MTNTNTDYTIQWPTATTQSYDQHQHWLNKRWRHRKRIDIPAGSVVTPSASFTFKEQADESGTKPVVNTRNVDGLFKEKRQIYLGRLHGDIYTHPYTAKATSGHDLWKLKEDVFSQLIIVSSKIQHLYCIMHVCSIIHLSWIPWPR